MSLHRIFVFLCFYLSVYVFANDGVFYARGNQLILVFEKDVSVKKEILTLTKVRNQYIEVVIYYEFFNPKDAKKVLVGFEVSSPSGDLDASAKNGIHPFIHDFTVELNEKILPFQVAMVSDSLYAKNGKIQSIDLKSFEGNTEVNYVDYSYVYHFQAHFNKGINIIKHTYTYDISSSVEYFYNFEYVLTAANRWANQQIDDFTLILNLGEFERFYVHSNFFASAKDWLINGIGKSADFKKDQFRVFSEKDGVKFHLQKGIILFQK